MKTVQEIYQEWKQESEVLFHLEGVDIHELTKKKKDLEQAFLYFDELVPIWIILRSAQNMELASQLLAHHPSLNHYEKMITNLPNNVIMQQYQALQRFESVVAMKSLVDEEGYYRVDWSDYANQWRQEVQEKIAAKQESIGEYEEEVKVALEKQKQYKETHQELLILERIIPELMKQKLTMEMDQLYEKACLQVKKTKVFKKITNRYWYRQVSRLFMAQLCQVETLFHHDSEQQGFLGQLMLREEASWQGWLTQPIDWIFNLPVPHVVAFLTLKVERLEKHLMSHQADYMKLQLQIEEAKQKIVQAQIEKKRLEEEYQGVMQLQRAFFGTQIWLSETRRQQLYQIEELLKDPEEVRSVAKLFPQLFQAVKEENLAETTVMVKVPPVVLTEKLKLERQAPILYFS